MNIYDAKLWVGSGFVAQDYTQHAFALELTYLRKLTGSLIAERSLKEMRRQGAISDAQAADWLAQLKRLIPDVRSGDQLVGIHSADGSTQLFLNGNLIGQTTDTALSRMFFGIWLSAQTSQPKMRLRLLGHSDASLP